MHYEKQPHEYAAAFTAVRTGSDGDGGHFYLGAYGIRVKASANSLVVWRPKDLHGTSLQNCDPKVTNPDFIQQGLAFVTSPRLPTVWNRYWTQVVEAKGKEATAKEAAIEAAAAAAEREILADNQNDEEGDDIYEDPDQTSDRATGGQV
jgi:hypothetical protein